MNRNDTNITPSSYFSDITIHLYENAVFIESVERKFGIDVNKDYFLATSFLYPPDMIVVYEDRHALMELLTPIAAHSPLSKFVDSLQFTTYDKGAAPLLAAHTRKESLNASTTVCDKILEPLKRSLPDVFIRIGIGALENGLTDIERTCQNSLRIVNAGEKFEKERRALDFIGMEVYSAINVMVLVHGQSSINTILLQLTNEEQTVLGKYYRCKEQVPVIAVVLHISEVEVRNTLRRVKEKTGLDVSDTEDNFRLNFIMIVKGVLEREEERR